jgi:hypothetical protein
MDRCVTGEIEAKCYPTGSLGNSFGGCAIKAVTDDRDEIMRDHRLAQGCAYAAGTPRNQYVSCC